VTYRGPQAFLQAVTELSKLPGVGEKTAQRLVFHLLHSDDKYIQALSTALLDLKTKISFCSVCCALTDIDPCAICQDPHRDRELVCIVEDPSDLFVIERSGQYRGVYHVLHGALSPLDGIGPTQLKVAELVKRVEAHKPREVVLATNPNVEGEATAIYLAKLLGEKGIVASRIAMGIPMGGHLEFSDQVTVGRAIRERRQFFAG
jgi:recombination protein RecR